MATQATRISYAKEWAAHLGRTALDHIRRGDIDLGVLTVRLAAHEADRAMYLEWLATDPQDGLFGGALPDYQRRPVWEAMQNMGAIRASDNRRAEIANRF